jgi:TatD DNase family protein
MTENPYIDIHTHRIRENENILSIVNLNLNDMGALSSPSWISVGIHPWDVHKVDTGKGLLLVKEYAQQSNVLAIGEIGLDKLSKSIEIQEQIFIDQLAIASMVKKPVIIHCVKCFSDLIRIKKETKSELAWILHGFNKNIQIAMSLLDHGCYLSFGHHLLKNERLQEVFKQVPNERIFLETDESDVLIESIYEKAAELKDTDLTELKKIILENYNTCIKK